MSVVHSAMETALEKNSLKPTHLENGHPKKPLICAGETILQESYKTGNILNPVLVDLTEIFYNRTFIFKFILPIFIKFQHLKFDFNEKSNLIKKNQIKSDYKKSLLLHE